MKRIDEKVKDIVEVRSHGSLVDFAVDPLETLNGYHFTDITADLMAKWLNAVVRTSRGEGSALALAGFRGVGKSHFIAAFGAMLAHSEYRSRLSDPFVASAAQGLVRRGYPVASVRRGSHATLIEEVKHALAPIIRCDPSVLGDSLDELLKFAAEASGDCSLILLIDTALGRPARVARDDGAALSEIADIGKAYGMFVGIALDDDISGADGINSAISRSFSIDYLDQEHLYRIVDSHIFPKYDRMRSVLHDIYDGYRSNVPGFRWSEDRFRSLYPLHPSIMEIAPFVRLYMHDFALLGFAAEAGSRILGRPADSLIALDEVFNKVEMQLRAAEGLNDAFAAFDLINDVVISKIQVMKRLEAKLILKGLFLLSLNDDGATAAEIGASMLIFDENDPAAAAANVESILQTFAAAAPDHLRVTPDSAGDQRYAFKINEKEDLKTALQTAADGVPDEIISAIFKKQMEERFADCKFVRSDEEPPSTFAECLTPWRGGLRTGRVYWNADNTISDLDVEAVLDWAVVVQPLDSGAQGVYKVAGVPVVSWSPSPLSDVELSTLKRYHVLMADADFRAEFHQHLSAPIQFHAAAAERIFHRSMITDGVLAIDGFEYNFTDEARSAQSLAQVFTIMIESLFEGRFPLHPYFQQLVEMTDVSQLVADFFGGASPHLAETQTLAAHLADPLGLVIRTADQYSPAEQDTLRSLPISSGILTVLGQDPDAVTSLESVFEMLSKPPYGLLREAAYLLLAAMVSARLIEFVTSNGDRINHRSLDLRLIWEDIVGIALPGDAGYSSERLAFWARTFTGVSAIKKIGGGDLQMVIDALAGWQDGWKRKQLNARFEQVSDLLLDTRIWRLARNSSRAFQIVSEAVSAILENSLPIEDGLERIADAFSDSETEYARLSADLISVEEFIARAKLIEEIGGWISMCESTGNTALDSARLELNAVLSAGFGSPAYRSNLELENLWEKFRAEYSHHFIDRHDEVLVSATLKQKLDDIFNTDLWWEFEGISADTPAGHRYRSEALSLAKSIRNLECRFDTRKLLEHSPGCGCYFSLTRAEMIADLPNMLWKTVNDGLIACRASVQTQTDGRDRREEITFLDDAEFASASEEFDAILESAST